LKFELTIQNGNDIYIPVVPDGVTWTTIRKGTPGKLIFTVIKDDVIKFTEGNKVRLTINDVNLFLGYVFTQKRDKKQQIEVTAFDQLRYLCNKDTYVYQNKTASDVIKMIASDFKLILGTIDQTEYKITSRTETNTSLFDIIYNAIDLELMHTQKRFVLFDDFGKLTLKSLDKMKVDLLIDEETGENFDYTSSIDEKTYNTIKLTSDHGKTHKREVKFAKDKNNNIENWGILQYTDTFQDGENGQTKADVLLSLYNVKTRKLKISNALGDIRIRAGCMIVVKLALGDVNVSNLMVVEQCTHKFKGSEHWMDLTLRGGEFVG